jgi:hypothetical protein
MRQHLRHIISTGLCRRFVLAVLPQNYLISIVVLVLQPGTTNPQVSLYVVDLTDLPSGFINIPAPVDVVTK